MNLIEKKTMNCKWKENVALKQEMDTVWIFSIENINIAYELIIHKAE